MRLKRTSGLEDGKGGQEQLAHDRCNHSQSRQAIGAQALGKRSQRRIVTQGNEGRRAEVPSLLEEPELAPDVAMLEGVSGAWEEWGYRDVAENLIGRQTLVREANDWHPHQPYAEREESVSFLNDARPAPEIDL